MPPRSDSPAPLLIEQNDKWLVGRRRLSAESWSSSRALEVGQAGDADQPTLWCTEDGGGQPAVA